MWLQEYIFATETIEICETPIFITQVVLALSRMLNANDFQEKIFCGIFSLKAIKAF